MFCQIGLPAPDDMHDFRYTQAIVKETLRLYPPLWMTGRQSRSPMRDRRRQRSGGALIMTSQWAVQRLPEYFRPA